MSYDFHLTASGPKLIEVNTNAGGAFLNAVLARAQRACCAVAPVPFEISPSQDFGSKIVDMFIDEWRRQRGSGRPTMIAIVDDAPEEQYLFPEFRLAKALLEEYGIETVIADAKELLLDEKTLIFGGRPIDLVYNRLVDFALQEPRHAVLQAAYVGGNVVATPNPHAHALFADKRNDSAVGCRWFETVGIGPEPVSMFSAHPCRRPSSSRPLMLTPFGEIAAIYSSSRRAATGARRLIAETRSPGKSGPRLLAANMSRSPTLPRARAAFSSTKRAQN